jgi:hypothetical protein
MAEANGNSNWARRNAAGIYLFFVGGLLLLGTWKALDLDGEVAAASLAILGGGALVIAPFAPYLEGTLKIGVVQMGLRSRMARAAVTASDETLQAVVTLLETDEIGVEIFEVPAEMDGEELTSPKLAFVRRDLNLSVVAIRLPGQKSWISGGQVSETVLRTGAFCLIAGPRDSLTKLRDRLKI